MARAADSVAQTLLGVALKTDSEPAVLSRRVARIRIPSTIFLDALFQIGRSSDQCLGVVLARRSSALMEVGSIDAENIKLGDLLTKLLESAS